MMKPSLFCPYPRVIDPELSGSSIPLNQPRPSRPQLTAQWIIGDDGKLICRWNIQ